MASYYIILTIAKKCVINGFYCLLIGTHRLQCSENWVLLCNGGDSTKHQKVSKKVRGIRWYHNIWRFPEIGVPPNHPFWWDSPLIDHPFFKSAAEGKAATNTAFFLNHWIVECPTVGFSTQYLYLYRGNCTGSQKKPWPTAHHIVLSYNIVLLNYIVSGFTRYVFARQTEPPGSECTLIFALFFM